MFTLIFAVCDVFGVGEQARAAVGGLVLLAIVAAVIAAMQGS